MEEFITILKEKDKYEKMKKNARSMDEKLEEKAENMRLNSVIQGLKKINMYKMIKISAETWNNAGVSVLKIHEYDDINKTLLLSLFISYISKRLGCANIYDLIDKEIKGKYNVKKMNEITKEQIRKYKISKSWLIKGSEQSMFAHEVIGIPIIMQTRFSKPEAIKFTSDLGFNQINLILKKEQSIIIPLLKAFSAEKIKLELKALENERVKTDMYFSEHELVVKIDEKEHIDRNQNKENGRQIKIEKSLNCKFHRINPDAEHFDIFVEISKIQNYITKSNEEKMKSKFARELLS